MLTNLETGTSLGVRGVGSSNLPVPTNSCLKSNVEEYLQEIALLRKPSTHNRSQQILIEYLPFATEQPKQGVLAYLKSCKDRGNDNHTLENKRVRVAAFYRQKLGLKIGVSKIQFLVRKPEVYTQAEIDAMFAAACDQRQLLWVKTLLQAGLRKQEAMYLEYGDLLDDGIQVVGHGTWSPKTHEERTVRVPRALIAGLRALPRIGGSNLLFPTAKGNVCLHMLRTMKRLGRKAGLNPVDVWLHKWRANFATTLLRGGMPLVDVSSQLGHSKISTTQRYLALLSDETMLDRVEAIWK